MDHTNKEIVRYLLYQQKKLNIPPEKFRVLDFGCGIGLSVLDLKQAGFDAHGVDIDPGEVSVGRKLLTKHGFDGENLLRVNNPDGTIPFDDHLFHFVMSQEVIEHVSDLPLLAREIKRVLVPGCISFHVHRPQYNIVEPHFLMPFVHWIPKSIWRKYAITFFIILGIGKKPPEIPPPGKDVLIERYYHESIFETYYRPYPSIGQAFIDNGFYIAFPVTNHRRIRNSRMFTALIRFPFFEQFLVWFMMTFHNAYLLLQSPNESRAIETDFVMDGWKTKLLGYTDISTGTSRERPSGLTTE